MQKNNRDGRNGMLMCIASVLGFAFMIGGAAWADYVRGPAYSLVYVEQDGNAYVMDHGMSSDDCTAALSPGYSCEVER